MDKLTPTEQKLVLFNDAEIMAVKCNDGKIRVGVKWICAGIGLDKSKSDVQVQKTQSDLVLSRGACKINLPTISGIQEVLCLELDFLPLWLAKINANIIDNLTIQDKIVDYQLHAKDVLAQAFIQKKELTQIEALLQTVQRMVEQERELQEIKEEQQQHTAELTTVKHRLDNMDSLDTIGDLQQRLNAMIRKYSNQEGIGYSKSWGEFVNSYNTAYRTNLTLLVNNYEEKTKRKVTKPQYLRDTGKLEDAIRVADKMLNQRFCEEYHG